MAGKDAYHHGDLRSALLTEGRELLAESGPDAFSLNELARRVGVSAAAPYRHFADRHAILDAIGDQGYEEFNSALLQAVSAAADPGDAIVRIARAYLDFADEQKACFSVMFRDRGERSNAVGEASFVTFADAVIAAQSAGALDPDQDPRALARGLWSAIHGAAVLEGAGGFSKLGLAVPRDQLVAEIVGPYLR